MGSPELVPADAPTPTEVVERNAPPEGRIAPALGRIAPAEPPRKPPSEGFFTERDNFCCYSPQKMAFRDGCQFSMGVWYAICGGIGAEGPHSIGEGRSALGGTRRWCAAFPKRLIIQERASGSGAHSLRRERPCLQSPRADRETRSIPPTDCTAPYPAV